MGQTDKTISREDVCVQFWEAPVKKKGGKPKGGNFELSFRKEYRRRESMSQERETTHVLWVHRGP